MAHMSFPPFSTDPAFLPTYVIVVRSCNLPAKRLTNGQQQTQNRTTKPWSP